MSVVYSILGSTSVAHYGNFTAIIPCVGVGNVSQLSCDLLIQNFDFKLASNLHFKYVPAAVGSYPYLKANSSSLTLTTCSQLYVNMEHNLAVLQTRSPPFPGCRRRHVNELITLLDSLKFSRIVLLSTSFGSQRKDSELIGTQLRYAVSHDVDNKESVRLENLRLTKLASQCEADTVELGIPKPTSTFYLPGGGVSSLLFDELTNQVSTPVFLLNLFTSEGDNASDAFLVASTVSEWLGLSKFSQNESNFTEDVLGIATGWRAPISWKLLYGSETLGSLY